MSVSILGQHISLIRPARTQTPKIYKSELPRIKYDKKPRTLSNRSGHVVAVCVKVGDKVFELAKGLHCDVLSAFQLDPMQVETTGWKLENGKYIWR